jgi:glycosyltransferase involved in cell wall biosynthesis
MLVGILAGCLGGRHGGPETYERELIRAIARVDVSNEYRIYAFYDGAEEALGPLPKNFSVRVLRPRSRWVSLSVTLPVAMVRDGVDVLHATMYPPPICPVPLVFTMHDISPIARPEFFTPAVYRRLNPLVRKGLRRAKVVICVSQDTMATTCALTDVERSRMRVIPHGVDAVFRPVKGEQARAAVRAQLGIERPYVLYVGKIMVRKNVVRLIEAFGRFVAATNADFSLVLAGKRLYDTAEVDEAIDRLGLRHRVHELGHVPDAMLPSLYAAADMVSCVTLWEGFGFPVIEAMASGVPVIASNLSSLPEVAGDAAALVDPRDVGAIADAMGQVYGDPDLRARLVRRGIRQAARFSWGRTAGETIQAYQVAAAYRGPRATESACEPRLSA